MRALALAGMLWMLLTGCGVGKQPSPTEVQQLILSPSPSPTTLSESPSPSPTTSNTASDGASSPACTPRSDWPLYSVSAGDTLGGLAERTGSSVSALMEANCLTNANLLAVGQGLRVPRQPAAPAQPLPAGCSFSTQQPGVSILDASAPGGPIVGTMEIGRAYTVTMQDALHWHILIDHAKGGWVNKQLGSSTGDCSDIPPGQPAPPPSGGDAPPAVGHLRVEPGTVQPDGSLLLTGGSSVTLHWEGVPASLGLTKVQFLLHSLEDNRAQPIASDLDLRDGSISATWTVPAGTQGVLSAGGFVGEHPRVNAVSPLLHISSP